MVNIISLATQIATNGAYSKRVCKQTHQAKQVLYQHQNQVYQHDLRWTTPTTPSSRSPGRPRLRLPSLDRDQKLDQKLDQKHDQNIGRRQLEESALKRCITSQVFSTTRGNGERPSRLATITTMEFGRQWNQRTISSSTLESPSPSKLSTSMPPCEVRSGRNASHSIATDCTALSTRTPRDSFIKTRYCYRFHSLAREMAKFASKSHGPRPTHQNADND